MNTPDWPRWDLNSCFGAFRTIWVHLVPFGCLTKLGAKQAKLGQKFVPRSRVGIFCNERTRSTPLDTNHIYLVCFVLFECIWYRLVALQNLVQNEPNWCQNSCHEVASLFFATKKPDWPRWDLNSYFDAFRTILVHLVPFGCLTKLGAKRAEVVQKFVPWSRVGFRNERTRSTLLDPNLKFRCVSYYLGVFGTVWLHYKT